MEQEAGIDPALADMLALIAEQDALVCVIDADGAVLYGNPSFWEFNSSSAVEGLGTPLPELTSEVLAEGVAASIPRLISKAFEKPKAQYGAIRLRGPEGTVHTFDVSIQPAADGRAALVICNDVTERDQTIADLDETQRLLESVMDSTAESIIATDMRGTITSTNAMARSMLESLTPETWSPPNLRASTLEGDEIDRRDLPIARSLRGEVVERTSVVLETVDGPALFEATARPLHDAFGTQIGAVSVWRDVTELSKTAETLSVTERFLEAILNATGDAIVAYSFDTGAKFINELAKEWRLERLAPLETVLDTVTSERGDGVFGSGLEMELPTEDGTREILASAVLIPGEGDRPVGAVEVARDVTDLKDHMKRLELVTAAFNSTVAAIAITSADGLIEWTNSSFTTMTGFPALLAKGKPLSILDTEDRSADWNEIFQTARGGSWEGRLEIQALNRRPITAELTISSVQNEAGEVTNLIAIIENITHQLRAEERIRYLATHDDLTGLPNRRILRELLEFALARSRRSGEALHLMFLDLDKFKNVNDTFGHPAGDQLIRKAGHRFKSLLRETDAVARLGGDEFAILTEAATTEDAERLAGRILAAMREPFNLMGSEVQVSTSIGITSSVGEKAPDELMDEADVALYEAKDIGRNTFVWFDEEMGRRLKANLQIAHELRDAITHNQFLLHYQPQYNLTDGSLTGVEALIRWSHPERGMVPPGLFIGVAEDHGLMRPIGRWVRKEAFRQAAEWDAAGVHVPVIGVNLSPMELKDPTFADTIIKEMEECPIDVQRVELELTEAALLSADPANTDVLSSLRNLGIRLAIDDFGTGYSSLLYLKQFRVNRIKVAQEFVKDLLNSATSASIVEATVRLAEGLGLDVIAEGVEEGDHAAILRDLGCNTGQGYFMARPMPAPEIPDFTTSEKLAAGT